MTDSLYILFLDEIYAPNLNEFRKKIKREIINSPTHLHFGISGVILPSSLQSGLGFRARKIKLKFYNENLIFHSSDILNNRNEYSDLAFDEEKRLHFIKSLRDLVHNTEFKYACTFIDKHELIKRYGRFEKGGLIKSIKEIGSNMFPESPFIDYNLYLLCLKSILVEFYKYLAVKKISSRGIVVAEARGEREDAEIRAAFNKLYLYGVSSIRATDLRKKIIDLFIVPKKQNYIGTQLADLVLYPTYDADVPLHGMRNDHVIDFNGCLVNKLIKNIIIPKL